MRVDDVEGPVVSAATRTPFEARRRVFVLERVDTMNDEVANRLLKTLEEPAAFVHPDPDDGRARPSARDGVVSRCQLVRFELPPAATIAAQLVEEGVPAERAEACAAGARERRAGSLPPPRTRGRSCARRSSTWWRRRSPAAPTRRGAVATAAGPSRGAGEAAEEAAAEAKRRLELEPKGRERKAIEKSSRKRRSETDGGRDGSR